MTRSTRSLLLITLLLTSAASADDQLPGKQPTVDGSRLYQAHCASCHRPLEQTDKPQRSSSRLRSAIEHLPSMNHLTSLNETEIEAISAALMEIDIHN